MFLPHVFIFISQETSVLKSMNCSICLVDKLKLVMIKEKMSSKKKGMPAETKHSLVKEQEKFSKSSHYLS